MAEKETNPFLRAVDAKLDAGEFVSNANNALRNAVQKRNDVFAKAEEQFNTFKAAGLSPDELSPIMKNALETQRRQVEAVSEAATVAGAPSKNPRFEKIIRSYENLGIHHAEQKTALAR